ncbi:hypothetical protein Tco_0591502 [Tanacetum coccineum]
MADQRTMAQLLQAPTEGYKDAIVVPAIIADNFELKHGLLTLIQNKPFFGHDKEDPHAHIRYFNKITSTEAWDRFKDLLRACPHHGFSELHQLDTFYNALNANDQDSLNSTTGGNFLDKMPRDCLAIIESKSKVHYSRSKAILSKVSKSTSTPGVSPDVAELKDMVKALLLDKKNQSQAPATVKAIEESCVTCGGAHSYHTSYQAPIQQNQVVPLSELEKIKKINEVNIKAMQTQINNVKNELRNEMQTSIQASMSNQTNELKNMMASFSQMNTASSSGSGSLPSNTVANPKGELKAITTRSGIVLDGPSVPMPPPFINPEEDERAEETLTDPELAEYTIKYQKILKALLSNKEKLLELANTPLNENCSAVILKKLPKKLGDPGKFLIPCGFSELKCKALADLSASINLIDIYNISYEDYLEDLFANKKITNHLSGNPSFSSKPDILTSDLTSPKVKDDIFDLEVDIVLIDKLLNLDSTKDLPPSHNINPLSGSTTSSSPSLTTPEISDYSLEEFADELALIDSFPLGNDDMTPEDVIKEIEYLLNRDPLAEYSPNNDLIYTIPEIFTDEHTLDYASPPSYDDADDNHFDFKTDNDECGKVLYDDPFDSKEIKIKDSKLLIDELDSPGSSSFLPHFLESDSVLYEDFFEVDTLTSSDNEDKVFNPGILVHENLYEVTNRVASDKNVKKISSSNASLILEDYNPPLSDHELPFHIEIPGSRTLLSFSSENEKKNFKPRILISKGVHSLLSELSHWDSKAFKVINIFESLMEIFPCSYGEDIRALDVSHDNILVWEILVSDIDKGTKMKPKPTNRARDWKEREKVKSQSQQVNKSKTKPNKKKSKMGQPGPI